MDLWSRFCSRQRVLETCVPLFQTDAEARVATRSIGRGATTRQVLCRSAAMDALVLGEVDRLVADWEAGRHVFDGLIYLAFRRGSAAGVEPLYIGKAETLGKGEGNLSANLRNLHRNRSNFARWGDNYAYHIGDLSATALPGHRSSQSTRKYRRWAEALFVDSPTANPKLRHPVYFWTRAWPRTEVGPWEDFGPTRLTFLEYLMIGVASAAFPGSLLNREGQNR